MSGSDVLMCMSTEIFECAICLEKYTNPKTLNCGHTFCGSPERCMRGLENDEGILCALCKTQNNVKEAVLKTNIFIREVVEQSRRPNTFEASSSRAFKQESNNSRTHSEALMTSKVLQCSSKIAPPSKWSKLKTVASSGAVEESIYSVNCAGQYIFAGTKCADSWTIRKYMWFESEAGIELEDVAKNDIDCILLRVAATQRENGSTLVYAAIRPSTGLCDIFLIDSDTLDTGRKLSLPSAIEGVRWMFISAWEDNLAVGGKGTLAILRNEQIVRRLDTQSRIPVWLSLTPAYVVFVTTNNTSSVYRWRSDDGTVLDEPVCLHVLDECAGTAVSGDTLLAIDVASKRFVRINISTGERVQMIGDEMAPFCFIRHDLVAGSVRSSNGDGRTLGIAELS